MTRHLRRSSPGDTPEPSNRARWQPIRIHATPRPAEEGGHIPRRCQVAPSRPGDNRAHLGELRQEGYHTPARLGRAGVGRAAHLLSAIGDRSQSDSRGPVAWWFAVVVARSGRSRRPPSAHSAVDYQPSTPAVVWCRPMGSTNGLFESGSRMTRLRNPKTAWTRSAVSTSAGSPAAYTWPSVTVIRWSA